MDLVVVGVMFIAYIIMALYMFSEKSLNDRIIISWIER